MTYTPPLPRPECVHEASHATVAHVNGFRVASVTRDYTRSYVELPCTACRAPDAARQLRRALMVDYAGAEGERILLHDKAACASDTDEDMAALWRETYAQRYGAAWVAQQADMAAFELERMLRDPAIAAAIVKLANCLQASYGGILHGFQIAEILAGVREGYETARQQRHEASRAARTAARDRRSYAALAWQARHTGYWGSLYWCVEPRYLSLVTSPTPQAAAPARTQPRQPQRPKGLAVIELSGPLVKQHSWFSALLGGTSTTQARVQLRDARLNPDIGAVLLLVYSPGGEFAGTAALAAEVRATAAAKPVHAHIEDLGASAAYWAASQATRITANATAEVGSIGTLAVVVDESKRYARLGIQTHVLSTGPYKGIGVEGSALASEGLRYLQSRIDSLNQFFLADVQRGRRLSLAALEAVSDGRMHMAAEARRLGLIDRVQSLDDVVRELTASTAAA